MSRKGKSIVQRRTAVKPIDDETIGINLTLRDALDFVQTYKQSEGLRERTVKEYRLIFGYFIEYLEEFQPDITHIEDVTGTVIREYIIYLSDERMNDKTGSKGLSPYTVNVRIRLLKSFFNVLHKENYLDKNPVAGVKLLKVDEDSFVPLSNDEIDRLLKAPDIQQYAQFRDLVAMYLILDTGIRSSEMFNLLISDVDFKSRCITLRGAITKNRKPRILPLSNQVLRLLMELITEVKANFDTEYLFVSNFGEQYRPNSFRRRISIYKDKANITKRLSPHSLRHQFCRDYILNGGDLFTLQRIAGHEDITTTRKYIQFTTEDIKKQHAQFSPIARLRSKYRK